MQGSIESFNDIIKPLYHGPLLKVQPACLPLIVFRKRPNFCVDQCSPPPPVINELLNDSSKINSFMCPKYC